MECELRYKKFSEISYIILSEESLFTIKETTLALQVFQSFPRYDY